MARKHGDEHILVRSRWPFEDKSFQYNCPRCGRPMIYAGEALQFGGDYFACCSCRQGWILMNIGTWKHKVRGRCFFPPWSFGPLELFGAWLHRMESEIGSRKKTTSGPTLNDIEDPSTRAKHLMHRCRHIEMQILEMWDKHYIIRKEIEQTKEREVCKK